MPKKVPPGSETLEQVSVRVPASVREILHYAADLRGYRSFQELLRPVVEELAQELSREPEIQAMIRAKQEFDARKAGELRHLVGEKKRREDHST
jgi:hypothetical protein